MDLSGKEQIHLQFLMPDICETDTYSTNNHTRIHGKETNFLFKYFVHGNFLMVRIRLGFFPINCNTNCMLTINLMLVTGNSMDAASQTIMFTKLIDTLNENAIILYLPDFVWQGKRKTN